MQVTDTSESFESVEETTLRHVQRDHTLCSSCVFVQAAAEQSVYNWQRRKDGFDFLYHTVYIRKLGIPYTLFLW